MVELESIACPNQDQEKILFFSRSRIFSFCFTLLKLTNYEPHSLCGNSTSQIMRSLTLVLLLRLLTLVAAFSGKLHPTCNFRQRTAPPRPLQSTFTEIDEKLGPAIKLQRSWFEAWGFAEPGGPKKSFQSNLFN